MKPTISQGSSQPPVAADSPAAGPGLPAASCAKCGACATVCPVFLTTGREEDTARGKLHLLARLDPAAASETYAEILSRCLLCGACEQVCSRGIKIRAELTAARARLGRQGGEQQLLRTAARHALAHPGWLKTIARCRDLLELLPPTSGLRLRLGLPTAAAPATTQPTPNLSDQQKTSPPVAGNSAAAETIAFFPGCYAAYLESGISAAIGSLLGKAGLPPPRPATGWHCCGLAAHSAGRLEQARELARRNIAAFTATSGPILVACASCTAHLSHYPELLADEPQWRPAAEAFAARLRDFPAFLEEAIGGGKAELAFTQQQPATTLLYHDPCHLRFDLKLTRQPRRLLARAPGLTLRELPHGPQCCGHGGLFHLAHPALADRILTRLTTDFQTAGAAVVTTACSGCLLHWQQARLAGHHQAEVIHLAQLLDLHTK